MNARISQNNNMINKKNSRKGMILLFGIMMGLVLVGGVSAYQKLCLSYGQSVPSANNPVYTCGDYLCQICVNDDLNPRINPAYCNSIVGCSTISNSSLDTEPPVLDILSPIEGEVYSSRKVLFDIRSDEPASLYYIDNINGRGRWKRLYSFTRSLTKGVSLKDGLNDITIKGKDKNGNEAEVVRSFYVDSKDPKIKKTYPKKGFASGDFEVEFDEVNPEELILHYGNGGVGMRDEVLDIGECEIVKKKYYCSVDVDLDDYDGSAISYWFELTDIAGNVDESKPLELEVDVTLPVLVNGDFWEQGVGRYNKYIYFNFEVDEVNFDEVSYSYTDSRGRLKSKRLCSRLRDGMCEVRKSFSRGEHELDVQISDEAGNIVSAGRVEFLVE